jgi:uncharacterized phage-associated protein
MIRFRFNQEKFTHLMRLLAKHTSRLDRLKAVKLLYFIDREHLLKHGRPVLGDQYVKMKLGPVPSKAYDLLKEIQKGEGREHGLTTIASGFEYAVFVAERNYNPDVFSDSERECIKDVLRRYGNQDGKELSDISHQQRPWAVAPAENQPIDYSLFFPDELGEYADAYEVMHLEQEGRDFEDSF